MGKSIALTTTKLFQRLLKPFGIRLCYAVSQLNIEKQTPDRKSHSWLI